MKNDPRKSETAERRRIRLEREQAVAAYEAMRAARPMKPPPGKIPARMATAAELALAKDQRLGIVGGAFRLGTVDE